MAITPPTSDTVATAKVANIAAKVALQTTLATNGSAAHAAAVQEEINKLYIDLVDYYMTTGKVQAKTICTQSGPGPTSNSIIYGT